MLCEGKTRDQLIQELEQLRQQVAQLQTAKESHQHLCQEQQTTTLPTSTPDLIFRLSREGILLDYVPAKRRMLPAPPEEFLGKQITDVFLPQEAELVLQCVRQVVRTGKAVTLEYQLPSQHEGEGIRDYEACYTPYGTEEVLAIVRDTTEYKKVVREASLAKEEWERAFDTLPDLVALIDGSHKIRRMNRAMAERLGVHPDDAAGKACHLCVHGTQTPPPSCPHAQMMVDGQEHTEEVYEESLGGDFLVTTTPMYDAQGQLLGSIHVARDITEQKQQDEEARARQRQIQRQHASLVQLATHDAVTDDDSDRAIQAITEMTAEALEVERIGVWLLSESDTELHCVDLFEWTNDRHSAGTILQVSDYPHYFAALKSERFIDAHNARRDPRTREFTQDYLIPQGITAMLDAVIRMRGRVVGVVCHEHVDTSRVWQTHEMAFAGAIADQVAQVLTSRDRRQAEEALRKSEARYRDIIALSQGVAYQRDWATGQFSFIDAGIERLTGYSPEEMTPQVFEDLIQQEERITESGVNRQNSITDQIGGAKATNYRADYCLQTRHGETIWVTDSAVQVRDAANELVGTLGMLQDITERKQAEEASRLQHGLSVSLSSVSGLEETLNCILGAILQVDGIDSGGIYLVDRRSGALNLMSHQGVSAEFAASTSYYDADSANTQLVKAGSPFYMHYRELASVLSNMPQSEGLRALAIIPVQHEGDVVAALNVASHKHDTIPDGTRTILETMASQIGGVLARVEAEDALRESQRNLQTLFDTVTDFLFIYSMDGHILRTNRVVEERLGYSAAELTAMHGTQVHSPDRQEEALAMLAEMIAGTRTTCSIPLMTREGAPIPAETRVGLGRWSGQDVLFGISRDITERVEAAAREDELRKRTEEQEKLAAVGQLAAGIAHDFNNLLTGVLGHAELGLMYPGVPDSLRQSLQVIQQQGQRAARLVQQILDFSRKSITQKHPLDLSHLLRESTPQLRHTTPGNVSLSVTAPAGESRVYADPAQMQQVLNNLVLNAREAMPDGGELHIQLARRYFSLGDRLPLPEMPPGEWIQLSVSDTGTGIPADVLSRIYEPFFTTKEVGQGSGLGLSQVYGIVRQHDGFINVSSRVGAGTTFAVYLPVLEPTADNTISEGRPSIPLGQNENILVVEGSVAVRDVVESMLMSLGYQVFSAQNAQEALAIYGQRVGAIPLVLTDMAMPKRGGLELRQMLRQTGADVRFVLMSDYPLEEEAQELLSEGVMGWVQKPLSMVKLAEAVHHALNAS